MPQSLSGIKGQLPRSTAEACPPQLGTAWEQQALWGFARLWPDVQGLSNQQGWVQVSLAGTSVGGENGSPSNIHRDLQLVIEGHGCMSLKVYF